MLPFYLADSLRAVDPVNHQSHVGTVNFPFFTCRCWRHFRSRLCDASI